MNTVHPGNFQCFIEVYEKNLRECLKKYPADYAWPESELPQVMGRMIQAISRGSFNKDSPAFKATCRELKIKHTYKAIAEFISL